MLDFIGKWKDKITDQIDTRIQIIKLDFVGRTSQVLSYLIFTIICLFLLLPVLLFLGMALGEYFSELLDSRGGGYLLTSLVFILLICLLIAIRKRFILAFTNLFIGVMTDNDGDDDDDEEQKKDAPARIGK